MTDDEVLFQYIAAAKSYVDCRTLPATMRLVVNGTETVESVTYLDSDGNSVTMQAELSGTSGW